MVVYYYLNSLVIKKCIYKEIILVLGNVCMFVASVCSSSSKYRDSIVNERGQSIVIHFPFNAYDTRSQPINV